MWIGPIARHLATFVLTTLIAGLLGATLVRFGSRFEAEEQQLDSGLDAQSLQALRGAHFQERNLSGFYAHFFGRVARGDLAFSRSLARPVREHILHKPSLVIADEPTSPLDVVTQAEVLKLFSRLNHGLTMAVLYI